MTRLTLPLILAVLWSCSSGAGTEPEVEPEAAAVVATAGQNQVGWPGAPLEERLEARVFDRFGAPIAGIDVKWTVLSGEGTLDIVRSVTGPDGRVTGDWTLGRGSVGQRVQARADPGFSAFFDADIGVPGEWAAVASLPTGVRAPAVATDGIRIFVFGGETTDRTIVGLTQIFDPASGEWSQGAPLPTPLVWSRAVYVAGRIHLLGGSDEVEIATTAHWIYDIGSDGWTAGPPLPGPLAKAAAGYVGGVVLVAGGIIRPGQYSSAVHFYHPQSETWSAGTDYHEPTINWQGAAVGGRFLIAGGRNGRRQTLPWMSEYDMEADRWWGRGGMPHRVEGYAASSAGGLYCVLGGRTTPPTGDFNTPLDHMQCFEYGLREWFLGSDLPTPVQEAGAVEVGGFLYVVGGWLADRTVSPAVYRMSIPTS